MEVSNFTPTEVFKTLRDLKNDDTKRKMVTLPEN